MAIQKRQMNQAVHRKVLNNGNISEYFEGWHGHIFIVSEWEKNNNNNNEILNV